MLSQVPGLGLTSMDRAALASLLVAARNNHHLYLDHAMQTLQMIWLRDGAHPLFFGEERKIFFPG